MTLKKRRNVLINELGFLADNVTYLINEEATKENILQSYLKFTSDEIDLDERILIFFAGHGHTKTGFRGEVGFLIPYDARANDVSTFIGWDDLTRYSELVRAKHILFIMDACYGGLAVTRNLQPGSARFLKDMMRRYSRQVLTAGKADEVVSDSGGPLPNHSVFTGHLITGLRGGAATEQGVITASSLMAYVYSRVANDRDSNQTPHYGYFDGDGDFILYAPHLNAIEEDEKKDLDNLIVIPFTEDDPLASTIQHKISRLLSDDASSIELFDFVTKEVRHFISMSNEDRFSLQTPFSKDEQLARISNYENVVADLSALLACLSYWLKPNHRQILQKAISRSIDSFGLPNGMPAWINLRWYPAIIKIYTSGIAAVEGQRYDSLANIFYTKVTSSDLPPKEEYYVKFVANAILNLNRDNTFKEIPGYEQHYTPLSDYLFKLLQPSLDDILFIGNNYENSFDEFEVLLALVAADLWQRDEGHMWAPIGRFGWKRSRHVSNDPLSRVISAAREQGMNWEPIRQGLFGGDLQRFTEVAEAFQAKVSQLNWW